MKVDIQIDLLGGNCPVQAEGTFNGIEFYFRARGEGWSIGVGGETDLAPDWYFEQPYGTKKFAAGWMSVAEARAFIEVAARRWIEAATKAEA